VSSRALFTLALALATAGFAYAGPRDQRQLVQKLQFEARATNDAAVAEAMDTLLKHPSFRTRMIEVLAEGDAPAGPAAPGSSIASDDKVRAAAEAYCQGHSEGYHRYSGGDLGWELGPIQWDAHHQTAWFDVKWTADGRYSMSRVNVDGLTLNVIPQRR
jgi:hypothetical protein